MEIRKWVDMGQEVKISIGVDDIRGALAERFAEVTDDRLYVEDGPNVHEVFAAFDSIANFLNALTDEHIALLSPVQRDVIRNYLARSAERFAERGESGKELGQ